MKITRFYVVSVENNGKTSISQEAYFSYEEAKNFIMNRSDKPEMIFPFRFESDRLIYRIHDVTAQGGNYEKQ